MLVVLDDVVKGGAPALGTPEGNQLGDPILGSDAGLKQSIVSGVSSSDDIAVVTADAAIRQKLVLRVLKVSIYLS